MISTQPTNKKIDFKQILCACNPVVGRLLFAALLMGWVIGIEYIEISIHAESSDFDTTSGGQSAAEWSLFFSLPSNHLFKLLVY